MIRHQWTNTGKSKDTDVVSFLTQIYSRMEKAATQASQFEESAKTKAAEYYDRGARLMTFQVGDLVLVLKPSVGNKLQARWKGPYTVVGKLSPTTYQVKKDRLATKTLTYHVNLLQQYSHVPPRTGGHS